MNELLRWLGVLARRQQARPELFEALLTGRFGPYARHRLRFMLPRIVLRLGIQFFEVFVLASVLPWEYFTPLLTYRASTALIGGSYWGALEELRTRVRHEVSKRHYETARLAIEGWLGLSLGLACCCLGGVGLWTHYAPDPASETGFSLFDAYGVACFLRLAMDLVSRTYHAGIFALTRVYRPLATMLLPDVFELGMVILGWNQLGPWGLALSIVVAGALRSFWGYYYARKAYGHSRIPRPRLLGVWRARRSLHVDALRRALVHALANGSAQLDAVLILALAQVPIGEGQELPLVVVYYVLRPLMSAAHGWTRVFYFDWKRLQAGVGRAFQPRMRVMLLRTGLGVVLTLGTLLGVLGYALWREQALAGLTALLFLFAARTAFSLEQLEAFSLGQYHRLVRLAALVLVSVLVFNWLHLGERQIVLGAAVVLLAAVVWSRRARRGIEVADDGARGLVAWLARLNATAEPVHVFCLCADRRIASAERLTRALPRCFVPQRVARAGHAHVVAFAPAEGAPRREQVVAAVGGALQELVRFEASTGSAAIERLILDGWFRRVLGLDLSVARATRAELLADFRLRVPEGHVLELDTARGRVASAPLSWAMRRVVLRELASRASGQRPRAPRDAPFRVAVLASGGVPQVVFVAPREASGFAVFGRTVEHATLCEAMGCGSSVVTSRLAG